MTLTVLPLWLYHILDWPMNTGPNGGYNFWSGIGSGSPIIAGIAIWWTKHNCHEHRCPRLSWHPDADGHPVCKVHHRDHPALGWFRSDRKHPRHAANRS
jgi:hypothetical protein